MDHPRTKNALETIDTLTEALERLYTERPKIDESGVNVIEEIRKRVKKLDAITMKLISKYYNQ